MAFSDISDWFIPEDDPQQTITYPGPRRVEQAYGEVAKTLHDLAVVAARNTIDFRITHEGVAFRGHLQRTVQGRVFILRRVALRLRPLKELGLPPEVVKVVLHESFAATGGLILVCGNPGQGKSTTAAALLVERVKKHGAFALTVEDPPEYELQGNYPSPSGRAGKLLQVQASNSSFSEDLRDALRCYPSHVKGAMLLVGEVRDAATAAQLLRAAVNGQIVITTTHAGDIVACLERVLALARDVMGRSEAAALLAHSLRLVLHQTLAHDKLETRFLFSAEPSSGVAATIKRAAAADGYGHLQMLSTEIEAQRAWLEAGVLITRMLGGSVTPSPLLRSAPGERRLEGR